jgi:alpha-beta hydrolase superfamily lysophospholipase
MVEWLALIRRRDMSLKWPKSATMVLTFWLLASAQASPSPASLTLQAHDKVLISALVYEARLPKGIILLFHQAGSSKAEYATIAPRLTAAGFTALAIDQRSGGSVYGPNETVSRLDKPATYEEAKADLEAALDWAVPRHLPIILWGSSYSAALVFEVGAEHANQVSAILAFSPGEYLHTRGAVARAAARVHVPIYITSSSDAAEIQAGRAILSASPASVKIQFAPKFGVHGSSTLIEARNPKGALENWDHVLAFLSALPKPPE